uniref:Glycosyl transferase n=1 Tax=Vibrio alginolyticus TaxID=663 RepID=A0A0N9DYZ5_VIBAL|nr:Glycosyl transferase [Vibrio alginolyticus]
MPAHNKKVKIVAIAKDEARYIVEWIYHHVYFGFDAFDIYVNNTSDGTVAILTRLAEKFDINIIMADDLYRSAPANFQTNAYNQSLQQADSDEFSHLAFLDIDEFWTPKDFSTGIHELLAEADNYDVLLFNWAIHRSETEFSRCFSQVNALITDHHVKSIAKVGCQARAGIHNAYGANLAYANSDLEPAVFADDVKAKIKAEHHLAPNVFVVHRLYRSQIEYVSMLGRGRPRGDRFKSNRTGYYLNNDHGYQFTVSPDKLETYYIGYEALIEECALEAMLADAQQFVMQRYHNLVKSIQHGVTYTEAKVLLRALKNISLPEISGMITLLNEKVNQMKIFQIGFNKAATASIYHYFKNDGFKALHWEGGNLSKTIKSNFEKGLPLLTGYEDFQVFTDMEHREEDQTAFYSAEQYFKELDQQYPDSIFILNYRDVDKWVQSRQNHPGYLQKTVNSTGMTPAEVVEEWKRNYSRHIEAVKQYFKDKSNLIVIDLDQDDSQKLYRELTERGIELSQKELPHTHKTKPAVSEQNKHIDAVRDAALFFAQDNIEVAYMLMKVAHELRPQGAVIAQKLNEFEAKLAADD